MNSKRPFFGDFLEKKQPYTPESIINRDDIFFCDMNKLLGRGSAEKAGAVAKVYSPSTASSKRHTPV